MMECSEIEPWWFLVEPLPGESISHFLGRFRRENELSASGLGKITGLGGAIGRWEKFRFIPPPIDRDLEALSRVVRVEVERLREMLPPKGVGMKHEPIRLCAACYAESPCHKIEWQLKTTRFCPEHRLTLLSECPNCGARFPFPSLWSEGSCKRCFWSFGEMIQWQNHMIRENY